MSKLIAVAWGGFLGAITRVALASWIVMHTESIIPWGTLSVNLLGSLGLALIFSLMANGLQLDDSIRLALTTGFFGSFTTFSTISLEAVNLLQVHGPYWWLLYELLNISGGLGAALLGLWWGQLLGKRFFKEAATGEVD